MRTSTLPETVFTLPERVPDELGQSFARDGYAFLPRLISDDGLNLLVAELRGLEQVAKRRDFTMECMNNSPRHLTTVGGRSILATSSLIPRLYQDPDLMRLVRAISGLDAIPVPDPTERHVANFLHRSGDTHGAHVDDYPLALILFVEAPPAPSFGGLLEYAPRAASLATLDTAAARRAFHRAGDGYLLRSDTTAHRVTPLTRAARRVALNFAYATDRACSVRTPSASLLYD